MAVYKSGYAALQVLVRPEVPFYHPITGVETSKVKALTVKFGVYGNEYSYPNPLTGELESHATIIGHYYDTEVAAEREEWSDDERASVEITLNRLCQEQPYLIAKVDLTLPPVPAPWPTYDTTAAAKITQFAISLGLAQETLAYERENEAREKIMVELEDWLTDNPPAPKDPEVEAAEQIMGMITL